MSSSPLLMHLSQHLITRYVTSLYYYIKKIYDVMKRAFKFISTDHKLFYKSCTIVTEDIHREFDNPIKNCEVMDAATIL